MILSNHATGNDSHTKLLIQSNNANGSSVFTDISAVGNTITGYGGIAHSTAQYKNGKSSIYFDGTDDYLSIPDSAVWDFLSDMSIDFWVYPTGTSAGVINPVIAHNGFATPANGGGWMLDLYPFDEKRLRFQFFRASNGGSKYSLITDLNSWVANQWQYVSVARVGSIVTICVNGAVVGQSSAFTDYDSATSALIIGSAYYEGSISWYSQCYLDQIRISKGIARKPIIPNRMF